MTADEECTNVPRYLVQIAVTRSTVSLYLSTRFVRVRLAPRVRVARAGEACIQSRCGCSAHEATSNGETLWGRSLELPGPAVLKLGKGPLSRRRVLVRAIEKAGRARG